MRRIDLLPAAYVARRQQRRNVAVVVGAALVVFLLLMAWFLLLTTQINDANEELADVRAQNAALQQEIDALAQFAELERELQSKRTALQTVMAGDIDWPAMMTQIAMVIPGEVWLETFTTSAGTTEGASPVGTEANPIRISRRSPMGRIQFTGQSVCMPGVARWLIRLGTVEDFSAIWLNNATEQDTRPGCEAVNFDSTLELGDGALSERFQGELE